MHSTANDSLVIVPTYDEAGNLMELARQIIDHAGFDLLVIDDNSPDGTGALADILAARSPERVHVLHRPQKHGLGAALKVGFRWALEAGYACIFQMDADLSHDPRSLPALRRELDHADVVIGSRYVAGGATAGWPAWRHALSRAGSAYAGLLLRLPQRDLTGGFKGFRRRALAALPLDRLRSRGFALQIEVTYVLARRGFRIAEVPITFRQRRAGKSKMNSGIALEALAAVTRLWAAPPVPAYQPIPVHVHVPRRRRLG
jgi:dolichol-phosphate mannosyltransferase